MSTSSGESHSSWGSSENASPFIRSFVNKCHKPGCEPGKAISKSGLYDLGMLKRADNCKLSWLEARVRVAPDELSGWADEFESAFADTWLAETDQLQRKPESAHIEETIRKRVEKFLRESGEGTARPFVLLDFTRVWNGKSGDMSALWPSEWSQRCTTQPPKLGGKTTRVHGFSFGGNWMFAMWRKLVCDGVERPDRVKWLLALREEIEDQLDTKFPERTWLTVGKEGFRGVPCTARAYERMMADQVEFPQAIRSIEHRHYWIFQDRIWWDDDGLTAEDVHALVVARQFKQQSQIRQSKALVAQGDAESTNRPGIPYEVRTLVYERDRGKCQQCGTNQDIQFDHIIPVAWGGSSEPKNLELLCAPCNQRKGASLSAD